MYVFPSDSVSHVLSHTVTTRKRATDKDLHSHKVISSKVGQRNNASPLDVVHREFTKKHDANENVNIILSADVISCFTFLFDRSKWLGNNVMLHDECSYNLRMGRWQFRMFKLISDDAVFPVVKHNASTLKNIYLMRIKTT